MTCKNPEILKSFSVGASQGSLRIWKLMDVRIFYVLFQDGHIISKCITWRFCRTLFATYLNLSGDHFRFFSESVAGVVILQSRLRLRDPWFSILPKKAMQAPLAKSLLEVDGVREVRQCGGGLDMGQNDVGKMGKIWVWIDPFFGWLRSNWEWNGPSDGKTQQESCRENIVYILVFVQIISHKVISPKNLFLKYNFSKVQLVRISNEWEHGEWS